LRGAQLMAHASDEASWHAVIKAFDEAIARDPAFAAAHALRATALIDLSVQTHDLASLERLRETARQSADTAVRLEPDFAVAYAARAFVRSVGFLDFGAATAQDVERAVSLAPGSAAAVKIFSSYFSFIGHRDAAIVGSQRAIELDPENYTVRSNYAIILTRARRYPEALEAIDEVKRINPADQWQGAIGDIYNATGRPALAVDVCAPVEVEAYGCLAIAYHALGRQAEAEEALRTQQAKNGDAGAFDYAEVYAQWGDIPQALKWLEIAARKKSRSIQNLRGDWALDPLRNEARYKAIEQEFHFPP
jgi:tetratricopeptide (TPR) repeat protein